MTDELPQPEREQRAVTIAELVELLRSGTLEVKGMLPWSSNYTFLCGIAEGDMATYAVYKPRQGEQPLWDFPRGTLCKREVAAFVVSEALGWTLVPPTVLRDGDYGVGSVQFFIDADQDQHYFTLRAEHVEEFQRMAVFDALINNADRKGGHCLLDSSGHIWGIDHGIAFHEEHKLRTVIWDWAGQLIPGDWLDDLAAVRADLDGETPLVEALTALINRRELAALRHRADQLLADRTFPTPGSGRSVPWPPI